MKSIPILALICFCLFSTACTRIFYKVYGIELSGEFDESKYESTIAQLKSLYPQGTMISVIGSFERFKQFQNSFSTLKVKNLSQPVQIMYFENNRLASYHLNCYAKGGWKGNLNWNYDHKFDYYIPKTAYPISDSMTTDLDDLLTIFELETKSSRDVIVIFWSNMFKKHVIGAFETVINNIQEYANCSYPPIILINIDDFFIQEFLKEKE